MTLNNEFSIFDKRIRPDDIEMEQCKKAHQCLREKLQTDKTISEIRVADFLQGSYPRNTITDSTKANDVDVILVTSLHEGQFSPDAALAIFEPFLVEHYPGKWSMNGRSINIELDGVELDLVPTSAPSEARIASLRAVDMYLNDELAFKATQPDDMLDPDETIGNSGKSLKDDWAKEPLRIPDRHAQCWQDTHPLATLVWTTAKNKACNQKFLRIARALKWWRKTVSGGPDHPKSYPLEHMVGDNCPESITSVAEGITLTLEAMYKRYQPFAANRSKPSLTPRGLKPDSNDVLSLITPEDFAGFVEELQIAARNARLAFDATDPHRSGNYWQKVLGDRFPAPSPPTPAGPAGGFSPRSSKSPSPVKGRFARSRTLG